MSLSPQEIAALEVVSIRAWPAARAGRVGAWPLFASSGFSGRINACYPLGDPGMDLDAAIAEVEAWYGAAGLPVRFKVTEPGDAPAGLTARLAAAGYGPTTETLMMLGPATGREHPAVRVGDVVEPAFERVFLSTADDPGDSRERLETLERIPRPRAFAQARVDGAVVAIGACAIEAPWAGVFAMRTDPGFRRRGLARAVLDALLAAAAAEGATGVWLQVEADNPGAIALYAAAGFTEVYRYRYWRRRDG